MRILSFLPALFITSSNCSLSDRSVTIYYIRHAESNWNAGKTAKAEMMSKLNPLAKASAHKQGPIVTDNDIVFRVKDNDRMVDAPLSPAGHMQSIALGKRVFGQKLEPALTNLESNPESIVLAVSNLARTQQTMANFLNQRNLKPRATINILNCLQEMSSSAARDARSVKDGRGISNAIPESMRTSEAAKQFNWVLGYNVKNIVDINTVFGGKSPEARIGDFIEWLNHHYDLDDRTFLVAGHSSWLQKLYKKKFGEVGAENVEERILKKFKLGNASMIKFTFDLVANNIREGSIRPGKTIPVYDAENSLDPARLNSPVSDSDTEEDEEARGA
jgi:phosphohistidine phosphatase SixA